MLGIKSTFSKILDFSKEYSLPGFSGVPVYDVIGFIYQEAMRDDIITRANSVAFSFFLSFNLWSNHKEIEDDQD